MYKFRTFESLLKFVETHRLGDIDTDNNGQLIIYTGLQEDECGNLTPWTENDEETE